MANAEVHCIILREAQELGTKKVGTKSRFRLAVAPQLHVEGLQAGSGSGVKGVKTVSKEEKVHDAHIRTGRDPRNSQAGNRNRHYGDHAPEPRRPTPV